MKFWKFMFENRYGNAVYTAIISIVLSVILGGCLSLIAGTFWNMTKNVFLLFFAPGIVTALLLVLTEIEEDLSFGFGCGLYYGSLLIISVFKKVDNKTLPYIAGILLTAVVCYAVYLKISKNK